MASYLAAYLANQIEMGNLNYADVVEKYPQYKEDIIDILTNDGYSHLIQK